MKVAILGATKGMGRAIARRMAERGDQVFLLGRDPEDLESHESDLKPVNWGAIWVIVTGLLVVGIGTGLAIALSPAG